jgi:hypothetical protein
MELMGRFLTAWEVFMFVLSSRAVKMLSRSALVLAFATINMIGHTAQALRYEYKKKVLCYEDLSPNDPDKYSFGSTLFLASFHGQTPEHIKLRKDLQLVDQVLKRDTVIPFVAAKLPEASRPHVYELEFLENLTVEVDLHRDSQKMKAILKHRNGEVEQTVQQMICTVSMYWETAI